MVQRINKYIATNSTCSCKLLKGRKVKLNRYLEATIPRKDATSRLRTFFVAVDLIKKSNVIKRRIKNKLVEYEIIGFDAQSTEVRIHIREELQKSNKVLYLISSFTP